MIRNHRLRWLLLLLSLFTRSGQSIKCMTCKSAAGDDACEAVGSRVTCTETLASNQFRYLRNLKKDITEPVRNTGYQCMKLRAHDKADLVKGCVFANLDLCSTFSETDTCLQCKEDHCNSKDFKDGGSKYGSSLALIIMGGVFVMVVGHLCS